MTLQERLCNSPKNSDCLEAADRIDALENEMARIRELWEADQIESSEQRTQIHQLRAQVETLTKDAVRYQWLRHGDNDKIILHVAYLPRNENLDVVIDTAMKEQV